MSSDWRVKVSRTAAHVRADISFAVIDAILVVLAYSSALGLRLLDPETARLRAEFTESLVVLLPLIILVHLATNIVFGAYGHVWEYASVAEAKRVVLAAATAIAVLLLGLVTYTLIDPGVAPAPAGTSGRPAEAIAEPWLRPIPVAVVVTGGLITLFAMGLVRFRSRLFSFKRNPAGTRGERAIIVGTGRAAVEVARSLTSATGGEVEGFVTDSSYEPSRRLVGLPVLGTINDLAELVDELEVDQVIVAEGGERMARKVLDACLYNSAHLRIVPELGTVLAGGPTTRDIRDLEITDLLPRPAVSTELDAVEALVRGSRVLVTGAGGSIGSEIVSQVLEFEPSEIVVLDHDETHLFEANLDWTRKTGRKPTDVLCDIRDRERVHRVFLEAKPEVVFHAAALKHVPILETCPEEAVATNVVGTRNVLDAARAAGVRRFVLISTDKAVAPTSVMGSTKRVAELMVQEAASEDDGCTYASVRFGNVLGSRGSVVPTFIRQIKAGGPVTLTDPDMRRYFMTVDEAVQLVLQAAALAMGGEIFVLDMAEPVRIGDLAHRLIRLAGMVPGQNIKVEVTGKREGEKMIEQLSLEPLLPTSNPKINIARTGTALGGAINEAVPRLTELAADGEMAGIRALLGEIVGASWSQDVIQGGVLEEVGEWT
ncbi:MAG TPA: nucleoside-diphosphate sugar epimerase/dehydratase [Acidimicrobiia bacterium]|nr:nucleoside-diphosphate sugar epimerase/dehydratase [Acidimicrobiia bacterium]